jgi:hypothetical protein
MAIELGQRSYGTGIPFVPTPVAVFNAGSGSPTSVKGLLTTADSGVSTVITNRIIGGPKG